MGPGILSNIFDGIERPLRDMEQATGPFIGRGCNIPALDPNREWEVTVLTKPGDRLGGGDVYAECPETPLITHRLMLPPGLSGEIVSAKPSGKYKVTDTVAELKDAKGNLHPLKLSPVSYTHLCTSAMALG